MGWRAYSTDRLAAGSSPNVVWGSSLSNGGLSNFWTSAVPRFAPEDFVEGGRLDERYVWPVRYDDLVPYYEHVEQHLVVTAGDTIVGVPDNDARYRHRLPPDWSELTQRASAQGVGLGVLPMAKGHPWMVALRGTEFGSFHCLLRPLLASGRLRMHAGAHVARIIWSPARSRVEAVEYVDRADGLLRQQPARAVVVAAGTIDTTMILLRSCSTDFPNGLGNSADLLGRYLHDHPREWWPARTRRPMKALSHPVYLARRPHAESPPLMATSHTIGLVAPRDRLRTYLRARTSSVGVQAFGTMIPTPDVGVRVDHSASDPIQSRPTIRLTYDSTAVANIVSGRDRLKQVLSEAGLEVDVDGPFHELAPGSSIHLAGSVRMHHDPRFGVLDAWNRMHDVPHVVVCDMSAFTTGPEKNPTLTAMALAMRAADRLADDLG
jgi:choline dehydrogenase-like flavoprotein